MRLITSCLLVFISLQLLAQDKAGIQFEHEAFDDLVAQAKAEDKLIFVDAFTTWCGPCKMMASQVFPQERVGEVFNARFINAKIDMEKGEGIELAKRYRVRAYPTYLFVNGDGELVHKGLGYIPADEFIALADVAVGDENLLSFSKRYDGGDRDPAFVRSYAKILGDVYEQDKANEVVGAYLGEPGDHWSEAENMKLIMDNPGELGGARFTYIVDHAEEFSKMSTTGQFINTIQNLIISDHMRSNRLRQLPETSVMAPVYAEKAGAMAEQLTSNYNMMYLERNDPAAYPAAAMAYFAKYPSNDAMELNSVAWNFFENVDDPNLLKTALGWAMESVRLDKQYMNMDTLAWLYHKMGMKAEARKTAEEAIEIAKADGQDYSETAPILEN